MANATNSSAIPLESLPSVDSSYTSNSVAFPTQGEAVGHVPDSESSSSKLTSSDKLSALSPLPSSSTLNRIRGATRGRHRSFDPSGSLPSIHSSPGSQTHNLPPPTPRAADSEPSLGHETHQPRVSFDSDKGSLPAAVRSIREAVTGRHGTRSDSAVMSSQKEGRHSPVSRSPSPGRTHSPLRLFGWNIHRTHSRDEPFVPVNPFQSHLRWFASPTTTPERRPIELDVQCEDTFTSCLPLPIQCSDTRSKWKAWITNTGIFFTDTLPRQVYLYLLLRLPSLYFSRVARIFEDAEVSKHEIQRMIQFCVPAMPPSESRSNAGAANTNGVGVNHATSRRADTILPSYPEDWVPPAVSPALARFKNSWEQFVDALLREWKTLNLVSALLCTAILTIFQVPEASGDPLTRWTAILSLICALMSLTYGCVYIVQFGTMRTMYKASRWAEEAQRTRTVIWWNVWVLLATPAVWLAWSMIAFCVSILSFVWRTGAEGDPEDGLRPPLGPGAALTIRVVVSVIFGMGLLYFILIMRTFGTYGEREKGRGPAGMGFKSTSFSALADGATASREPRNALDQDYDTAFRGRSRVQDSARSPDLKESPAAMGLGLTFDPGSGTRLGALREIGSDGTLSENDRYKISPNVSPKL